MKRTFCRAECSATPLKLEWDILPRDRRSFMMGCEEFSMQCAAAASLDVACRRAGERSLVELRWSPQALPQYLAVLASLHSELAAFHAIIALQVPVVRFWVRLCAGDRAAADCLRLLHGGAGRGRSGHGAPCARRTELMP